MLQSNQSHLTEEEKKQILLENYLEKIMMTARIKKKQIPIFCAGVLDVLLEFDAITLNVHDDLYLNYVG